MTEIHKWKKEIIAWLNGEKVQWAGVGCENWQDLKDKDWVAFDTRCLKFRIAPKTININGHEVPEPCREKLKYGTEYFYPNIGYSMSYPSDTWVDHPIDYARSINGLVHLTKEAAIKHAEALISFTREIESSEADEREQSRLDKERQTIACEKELGLTEEEIKIFNLNIDEREEIIQKVWAEMKDSLCLNHRTFGHQLIEEVFKKRGEK